MPAVFPHAAPDAQSDDDESHEPDGEPDLEPRFHGNGVLDSYFWQVGRVDGQGCVWPGGAVCGLAGGGGVEGEGHVHAVGGVVPGVGAEEGVVHVDVDVAHGVGDGGGVEEEGLGGVGGGGVRVVDLDVVLRVVVEEVGVPGHWRINQYVALGDSGFGQRWGGFQAKIDVPA